MITVELLTVILLAFISRFLIPQMMYAEKSGLRFGIGCGLFGMYTVACVAMFRYVCIHMNNRTDIVNLSGSEVWTGVICAFILVNVSVLFTACIFFFTREKRKLSQKEKIKLKDL